MQRWKFGMGRHGEQGLEHIHSEFNRIGNSRKQCVNKKDRLLNIMKDHVTKVNPGGYDAE